MFRYFLIFFCFTFSVITLHAQSVFNGRVFENKTRITLHGIRVENLNNRLVALTGDDGRFSIAAKVGDFLVLKGGFYV